MVISNPDVANEYLSIMDELGVGINLSKSLQSPKGKVCEFAKKLYNPEDCSPIPIKETLASLSAITNMVEFVKKYKLKPSMVLRLAGYGYKRIGGISTPFRKLPSKARCLLLALTNPEGC